MLIKLWCWFFGHKIWKLVRTNGVIDSKEATPYCGRCGKYLGEWWNGN